MDLGQPPEPPAPETPLAKAAPEKPLTPEPPSAPDGPVAPGPSAPSASAAAPEAPAEFEPAADEPPLGLRAQVGSTRQAFLGLARAHVDLAKAEASEIGDEVKRAAAFGCLAASGLAFLGILVPVGLVLFLGEWLFGSMGWGILHVTLLVVAVAVASVLGAVRVDGIRWDVLGGLVAGVVFAAVFGTHLPNLAWTAIADATGMTAFTNEGARPLVVGIVVLGVVGAVVGALLGSRSGGKAGAIGFVVGLAIGGLVGAISAVTFTWHVAIALGIVLGLLTWPALDALRLWRTGIDADSLRARFVPQATIDTAKETLEWVRERTPLGNRF